MNTRGRVISLYSASIKSPNDTVTALEYTSDFREDATILDLTSSIMQTLCDGI